MSGSGFAQFRPSNFNFCYFLFFSDKTTTKESERSQTNGG